MAKKRSKQGLIEEGENLFGRGVGGSFMIFAPIYGP
jgi:hypothetical protein